MLNASLRRVFIVPPTPGMWDSRESDARRLRNRRVPNGWRPFVSLLRYRDNISNAEVAKNRKLSVRFWEILDLQTDAGEQLQWLHTWGTN